MSIPVYAVPTTARRNLSLPTRITDTGTSTGTGGGEYEVIPRFRRWAWSLDRPRLSLSTNFGRRSSTGSRSSGAARQTDKSKWADRNKSRYTRGKRRGGRLGVAPLERGDVVPPYEWTIDNLCYALSVGMGYPSYVHIKMESFTVGTTRVTPPDQILNLGNIGDVQVLNMEGLRNKPVFQTNFTVTTKPDYSPSYMFMRTKHKLTKYILRGLRARKGSGKYTFSGYIEGMNRHTPDQVLAQLQNWYVQAGHGISGLHVEWYSGFDGEQALNYKHAMGLLHNRMASQRKRRRSRSRSKSRSRSRSRRSRSRSRRSRSRSSSSRRSSRKGSRRRRSNRECRNAKGQFITKRGCEIRKALTGSRLHKSIRRGGKGKSPKRKHGTRKKKARSRSRSRSRSSSYPSLYKRIDNWRSGIPVGAVPPVSPGRSWRGSLPRGAIGTPPSGSGPPPPDDGGGGGGGSGRGSNWRRSLPRGSVGPLPAWMVGRIPVSSRSSSFTTLQRHAITQTRKRQIQDKIEKWKKQYPERPLADIEAWAYGEIPFGEKASTGGTVRFDDNPEVIPEAPIPTPIPKPRKRKSPYQNVIPPLVPVPGSSAYANVPRQITPSPSPQYLNTGYGNLGVPGLDTSSRAFFTKYFTGTPEPELAGLPWSEGRVWASGVPSIVVSQINHLIYS